MFYHKKMNINIKENSLALSCGYASIIEIAEKISIQTGLRNIDSFEPIIIGLGGNIVYQSLKEWEDVNSLSISVLGQKSFNVYVPLNGGEMNKLAYASSLCHYLLHSKEGKIPFNYKRFDNNLLNKEALWFGLEILIPSSVFKMTSKSSTMTDDVLSSFFKVPEPLISLKRKMLNNVVDIDIR